VYRQSIDRPHSCTLGYINLLAISNIPPFLFGGVGRGNPAEPPTPISPAGITLCIALGLIIKQNSYFAYFFTRKIAFLSLARLIYDYFMYIMYIIQ